MPTCKYCERTDYSLSVNWRGICQDCARTVGPDIEKRIKVVYSYNQSLPTLTDPVIYLGQLEILRNNLEYLMHVYHDKGIETTSPDPKQMLLDLVRFNNAKHNLMPEMYPFLAIEVPTYRKFSTD